MTEAIANWMNDTLGGVFPPEALIFLVSMIPILELRGGMIIAGLAQIPLLKALSICIVGNLIPVPFILWLITPVFNWMKRWKIFRPLVEKLEGKATGGKSQRIRRYQFLGLVLFVGIPLPGTGAWTGSLIAALINMDKKKALLAVVLGVLLASVIMSFLSYGLLDAILSLF